MKKNHLYASLIPFVLISAFAPTSSRAGIAQGSESNTKNGNNALQNNTTGTNNSAYGDQALFNNTTGTDNTAIGYQALYSNSDGTLNTAVGSQALYNSTQPAGPVGSTAVGYQSLYSNTTGGNNQAFGFQTLFSNTTGTRNLAVGDSVLFSLTSGDSNTAVGNASLINSETVNFNTALGRRSLFRTQGDQNIGLGFFAGSNLSDGGTNNIYLGSIGPDPIGSESNTIRIGTQIATTATGPGNPPVETHPFPAHTDTYIAGIFGSGTDVAGVPVYVDASGKLGTLPSSARFKQDVHPMDNASERIFSLRPVTFRYKRAISKDSAPQFGLVAEEVAKVNPDLVVRDAKGETYSVRYEAVNAMMLNELIKEHRLVEEQQNQIEKLSAQLKEQASMLQKVSTQIELNRSAPRTVANSD
jgi:trimeric autotransporter adhesin